MKKDKVGLITTHSVVNYGAVLQAFALHKAIIDLGYDCEVIDYEPSAKISSKKNQYKFNNIRSAVSSILLLVNLKYRKDLLKKINNFELFLNKYFNLSKDKYSTYQEINTMLLHSKYNTLICGSDQIWNLNLMDDPVYFLEFSKSNLNIKFIAYAPSISEKLSDKQYNYLLKKVHHFSALSLREKNDAEFLTNFSNQDFNNVLDPVFLLEKHVWNNLTKPMNINKPYILCYEISSDSNFTKALKLIRKKFPYKLVCINTKPYNKHHADVLLTNVSPENFLWLIQNSSLVATSSFHAVAFSVIFEKEFYAIASEHRSSRQRSLLEQVGLEDRLLTNANDLNKINSDNKIKYITVKNKLNKLMNKSLNYLKNSLKDAK